MFQKFLILNFSFVLLFVMQVGATPFTDNGDGTVKDHATNLVWQKCSQGLSGTTCSSGSATTATWANAISYCNSLSLASKTWRLPNINELRTIINYGFVGNNGSASIATVAAFYWSSTTNAANTTFAWSVYFGRGNAYHDNKTSSVYVRCVSGP